MAHGDYCPRCRTMHDILKDCPPTIEPGVPVVGSISRDLLDAQEEIRRLNLQIRDLKEAAEAALAFLQFDQPNNKGSVGDVISKLINASNAAAAKPVGEKCSVCSGPREEAAWSGICGNCQDKGHRPEKRICESCKGPREADRLVLCVKCEAEVGKELDGRNEESCACGKCWYCEHRV